MHKIRLFPSVASWSFPQVPGDLRTSEDKLGFSPIFNPLLLQRINIFISRYSEYSLHPSYSQHFCFGSVSAAGVHLEAPQCTTAPSTQVPHIPSSLAPDFRLLLSPFLSLDFSLCLCDQLEGTGKGNEQNEDQMEKGNKEIKRCLFS